MYAARRNRIRLRITLTVTIAALFIGAMLTLQIAKTELARINTARLSAPQTATGGFDWVEALSALGEQVIQTFITITSETR